MLSAALAATYEVWLAVDGGSSTAAFEGEEAIETFDKRVTLSNGQLVDLSIQAT